MAASLAKFPSLRFGAVGGHNRVPSPYPWLMPVILVMGLFYLYPVVDVFRFAFTDLTLLGGEGHYTLATFANVLSRPELLQILGVTAVFTLGSVFGQQLLGLVMALVVVRSEKRRLFGTTILRTTALVAWVVPGIAGGIIWKMLFNEAPFGGLNSLLRLMGLAPVQWLSDPSIVMWSVVLSNVWRGTAFSMVVMYAALKGIDPSLYEAAEVDGATPWQQFRTITFPRIWAYFTITMVLSVKGFLQVYDASDALTNGGPGTATESVTMLIQRGGLSGGEFAYQTANAVIFFIVITIVSLIQFKGLGTGEADS